MKGTVPIMKILSSGRRGLGTLAAIVLLAGCGGSGLQSQLGPSSPIQQNATQPNPDSQTRLSHGLPGSGVVEFAYVTNYSDDTVSAYKIKTSGALTPVTGSPFGAGTQPAAVAVDPKGKFAYVANEDSNNVSAYSINASSGALTPVAGVAVWGGQRTLWRSGRS